MYNMTKRVYGRFRGYVSLTITEGYIENINKSLREGYADPPEVTEQMLIDVIENNGFDEPIMVATKSGRGEDSLSDILMDWLYDDLWDREIEGLDLEVDDFYD